MSTLYVGVDWHKRSSTWVAIDTQRRKVFEGSFACTPSEVSRAITALPAEPGEITLAIEPVCGWRWATQLCEELGVRTSVANPKALRQIAECAKKTDKHDALTLAELLRAEYLPKAYRAPDEVHKLRKTVRLRAFYISITTSIKCRIHSLCTAMGAHVTTGRPLLANGKRELMESEHHEIRDMLKLLHELEVHIKEIELVLEKEARDNPLVKLLMTMPGVGIITGTAIVAEVGDFRRFPKAKSLVSYAGLHPRERSSGERQYFSHISKEGSVVLRYSIVEAALRVRDTEKSQQLYRFYKRLIQSGKKPKVARVALGQKMLSILWYMATRNESYNHAIMPAQSGVIS